MDRFEVGGTGAAERFGIVRHEVRGPKVSRLITEPSYLLLAAEASVEVALV